MQKINPFFKKIFIIGTAAAVLLGLHATLLAAPKALAQTPPPPTANINDICDPATGGLKAPYNADPQYNRYICPPKTSPPCDVRDENSSCALFKYIDLAVSFMAAIVGIVAVILILIGGIQYTAAGEDPNKVAKAKKRIGSAIGALVAFGLLYAVLQYLVPGGIF